MLSEIKHKQAFFFLILLISIGIGVQFFIYKIAIIALFLQWLISTDYKQKVLRIKQNNFGLALIGLFCLYAISFLWSENQVVSIADIVLKSPLLLFPLVIFSQKSLSLKQLNQVFLLFAFGSVLINLICFTDAYL